MHLFTLLKWLDEYMCMRYKGFLKIKNRLNICIQNHQVQFFFFSISCKKQYIIDIGNAALLESILIKEILLNHKSCLISILLVTLQFLVTYSFSNLNWACRFLNGFSNWTFLFKTLVSWKKIFSQSHFFNLYSI